MSTTAQLPADLDRPLRLRWDSSSPTPLPPILLSLERPPELTTPWFSRYRVGTVNWQLELSRASWSLDAPWRAPERSVRMAYTVSQVLGRCDALGWPFDLLVFPAGTLNYYGTPGSPASILETEEVARILGALRRARRTVSSVIFGVDVWSYEESGTELARAPDRRMDRGQISQATAALTSRVTSEAASRFTPQLTPLATWQYLVAAEVGETPRVYQKQAPGIDEAGILQPGDGSSGAVQLVGRQVRLSLDEERFEGGPYVHPATRARDGAEVWVNPLHIAHPSGGASAGRWPVGRVGTLMRDSTCPIFLPHYRRTRLEGPFWFAGHPDQARPHRWQPMSEAGLRCGNERVQLLTFDVT